MGIHIRIRIYVYIYMHAGNIFPAWVGPRPGPRLADPPPIPAALGRGPTRARPTQGICAVYEFILKYLSNNPCLFLAGSSRLQSSCGLLLSRTRTTIAQSARRRSKTHDKLSKTLENNRKRSKTLCLETLEDVQNLSKTVENAAWRCSKTPEDAQTRLKTFKDARKSRRHSKMFEDVHKRSKTLKGVRKACCKKLFEKDVSATFHSALTTLLHYKANARKHSKVIENAC